MTPKKRSAKKPLFAKQAAKYGLVVSRRGPFRTRTFRVEAQVLGKFLIEVDRRGLKLQDAISDAIELWLRA